MIDSIVELSLPDEKTREEIFRVHTAGMPVEKAFDSISRNVLKKIMRHYGIPEKIVNIIMDMHSGTFCKVMVDGGFTDAFEVNSGVLQNDSS